jgi:cell division protein FtsQ
VYVKGSTLYTSQEIAERVISDDSQLRHNTVFLTILYHTPLAPKIPFVERVDVKPESFDTITITVKDKKMAGYIPYGGRNIYFSADGITLENSPLTVKGVTYVTGVTLNEAEVGLPLSSEDPQGLSLVLDALKILRKYEIKPESVVLTQSGSVTMFIGDVKVILGRSDYELKIAKIAQILPYLEGRKGTIDLTNYTSSDQNIILK